MKALHFLLINKYLIWIPVLFFFLKIKIVYSQVFIPFGFRRPPFITLSGTYRSWSDGTVAKSCEDYIRPVNSPYTYSGDIGSGVYRIQPTAYLYAFDVFCDMDNDTGGWMLAAVPKRDTAKMSEPTGLLDPTVSTATRHSEIWSTTSQVPFKNIRFTNAWPAPTSRNIAMFSADQTFEGLMTTYSTYSQNNVIASGFDITSNIGSSCFIIRGKSGTQSPYSDSADWLWMGFHSLCNIPLNYGDLWDKAGAAVSATEWVVGGKDNGDGMLASTSVGINSGNRHWNFNNSATYDINTPTIVWVR